MTLCRHQLDTNVDGTTPVQGPVEGSNGPTTRVVRVGDNNGGPSGAKSRTKLLMRRQMKVVEIKSSEVLETWPTQFSITT
ncbi:hypothetical protein RHGRI_018864 [Rhododendron griersonianum]|uniref:Uncharacterized protein n=1 Tax=Rhododendron griersonianum TaxID=479676 RepID=A0AAV6K354_9ERIC|nr:hypothetical protein RHGRI_018864 [Rhododendron griersonianum]